MLLPTAAVVTVTAANQVEHGPKALKPSLAASLAAMRAGVSREAIAAAVRTFKAVEHRLEFVRTVDGIDFYNDSKATSVDATLKALDAFPGGLWVILGGKDKGLDYAALREPLRAKAHAALLIGAAAVRSLRQRSLMATNSGDSVTLRSRGRGSVIAMRSRMRPGRVPIT